MSRKIKKSVSILLALVMLCGVLAVAPVAVSAAVQTYTVGTATYSFNSDNGNLNLVSGTFNRYSWGSNITKDDVLSVTADDGVVFTGSCLSMFMEFTNCKSIDLSKVNTSTVTDMQAMFIRCTSLESLNLSGSFNTGNVTNTSYMFWGCESLKTLDISNFTSNQGKNIQTAQSMFKNCYELESLNIGKFNILTGNTKYAFEGCNNLKEITANHGVNINSRLNTGTNEWGWRVDDPSPNTRSAKRIDNMDVKDTEDNNYYSYWNRSLTNPVKYIWKTTYGVEWNNYDGTRLYYNCDEYDIETALKDNLTQEEKEYLTPKYIGEIPTKPNSGDTAYTFVGWVDDLGNEYGVNDVLPLVTRDTTYTALFEEAKPEEYTLNYIYQGRSGGNNGGYVGDNEADDEKTYTVTVELGDSDLEESGMPKAKVLVDNAPVVNDPYKNCRWTFTDEYVRFDPENKVVTITANQPERKYSVIFKDSNGDTTDAFRVKLNEYVKKNDSFITVPETDGSGTKFAYWSVVQNDKEVARCFERRFNLRVTGDSVVTANYGEAENLISLSDAEITRQPIYQNGIPKDCLYADFITAYMDKQGMELSKKSSSEYKTGLILQYNKEILVKENEPGATLNANDKITFGSDYELTAADAKTIKTIADGETVSGKYSYKSISIDNSKYNDKNRLNKALPIENTELNRRMVYCAYYYVYNVKAGKIEMTAPVYFYLYDKGNEINTEN